MNDCRLVFNAMNREHNDVGGRHLRQYDDHRDLCRHEAPRRPQRPIPSGTAAGFDKVTASHF
jgi:hypothetical protein